jgi:hypothetical protein
VILTSIIQRVRASSIAEVVIALSIIALCFGIASLVFIRSLGTSARFEDVRKQTEIQSQVLKHLFIHGDSLRLMQPDQTMVEIHADEQNDSLDVLEVKSLSDRLLWNQQILKK